MSSYGKTVKNVPLQQLSKQTKLWKKEYVDIGTIVEKRERSQTVIVLSGFVQTE